MRNAKWWVFLKTIMKRDRLEWRVADEIWLKCFKIFWSDCFNIPTNLEEMWQERSMRWIAGYLCQREVITVSCIISNDIYNYCGGGGECREISCHHKQWISNRFYHTQMSREFHYGRQSKMLYYWIIWAMTVNGQWHLCHIKDWEDNERFIIPRNTNRNIRMCY